MNLILKMNHSKKIIITVILTILFISTSFSILLAEKKENTKDSTSLNEYIWINADSNLGILTLNNGFLHGRDENSPDINETLINALNPEEWKLYKTNSYILAQRHQANITYGLADHYAWDQGGFPEANPWENWSYYEEFILYVMQVYDYYFPDYQPKFYNIWNEPDHSYYWHGTYEQLLELYYRAYTVVKNYKPEAKVVGPSIAWFRPGFPGVEGIIDFLVDLDNIYGIRLDAISWHENGGTSADTKPEDIPYRANYLRSQIEANFPSDYNPELHINEYMGGTVHLSPGWNVGFLKYLEIADIDRCMRACWWIYSLEPYEYWCDCWYGLNGMFMKDGQTPQRVYWTQYTYSDMEGNIKLQVKESHENTNAIAIRNESTDMIKLLVGRYFKTSPNTVVIQLDNYSYNSSYVNVIIQKIPNDPSFYTSPPQAIPMPYGPINLSTNYIPVIEGSFSIILDDYMDGDAYIVTITPLDLGIEIVDINQYAFDRGFPIRHALDGDWAAAQNYIPTVDLITRVEISMRKFGTPEFNLTVELREDHPQGTLQDTKVFTPDDVPSSWEWFEIDFNDSMVTPDTEYFIVCPPAPPGVTTSFGYEWGYAFGNQYDDGAFWFTRDGGGLWRDLPTMYEFMFRTYGYS